MDPITIVDASGANTFEFASLPAGDGVTLTYTGTWASGTVTNTATVNAAAGTDGAAPTCTASNIAVYTGICPTNGGRTLGFWSNRNGQAIMGTGANLDTLRALNLRNKDGSDYAAPTVADVRTWLLNGEATNMAYMLSVQLAAARLSVDNAAAIPAPNGAPLTLDGTLLHDPSLQFNGSEYVPLGAVMDAANALLGSTGLIPAGHELRGRAELIKDLLDGAVNNHGWTTQCAYLA